MLRKTATLAGSLVLAVSTAGEAQERPDARATVMAKLEVLESVATGRAGTAVEWSGEVVSVSSEWDIAGRVPVVMAAHVLPVSVTDRWTARREARGVERDDRRPSVVPEGRAVGGVPVSRHTVEIQAVTGGYRVVWYAVVAL